MKCPKCGKALRANAHYCSECGKKIVHKKTIFNTIFKILLIVLVVAVTGVILWFFGYSFLQSSKNQPISDTITSNTASEATTSFELRSEAEEIIEGDFAQITGDYSIYVAPLNADDPILINNQQQRAASTIKLFIMAAAYSMASDGEFDLSKEYVLNYSDIVGGTGSIQYRSTGTTFTMDELITYMIADNDNTACNILIDEMGGLSNVNRVINELGYTDTKLQRKMLDYTSLANGIDNMTSVNDAADILEKIYNSNLVSADYDKLMLDLLKIDDHETKLSAYVESTVTIYHSIGDFDDYGVQNDLSIFEVDGKAYIIAVLMQDGYRNEQLTAMNNLGQDLAELFFEE